MKQDHHVGVGKAPSNAFPKHHALASGKQNAERAIPGGKAVKGGDKVKNDK